LPQGGRARHPPTSITSAPAEPVTSTSAASVTSEDGPVTIDAPALALTGTLIDGTGAGPILDGILVIQGETIVAVGPRDEVTIPADAHVIDLAGVTILPGFICIHVHNAYSPSNLGTWARNGVATVRDLGAPWVDPPDSFSLRDQLDRYPKNARLISAGPLVTVPGGYPIAGNNFDSLTIDSPEDAREKIAQLIEDGAEVIKMSLTLYSAPSLWLEEATVVVETAHERGIPVTAHATTARALERALDVGVDDIAHWSTDRASDELIHRMIDQDVSWIPTLAILKGARAPYVSRSVPRGVPCNPITPDTGRQVPAFGVATRTRNRPLGVDVADHRPRSPKPSEPIPSPPVGLPQLRLPHFVKPVGFQISRRLSRVPEIENRGRGHSGPGDPPWKRH